MRTRTMFLSALALAAAASCAPDLDGKTSQSRAAITSDLGSDAPDGGTALDSGDTSGSDSSTGDGSGSGNCTTGCDGGGAAQPTSTISVTYDDGNPTSMFPFPPSMSTRCDIPQEVLDTLPIYNGDPKMKFCNLITTVTGNPPTSMSITLYCSNSTGNSGYDYFTCTTSASLLPPTASTTGFMSYGAVGAGSPELPAATCTAYIARAQGICNQTGVLAK